jgi:predicted dehydrogenase
MDSVNVGIIGAGIISNVTLNGYTTHPSARVIAVCDIDEQRGREKAERWRVPNVYADYEALLRNPEINAVHILLPHSLHAKVAIAVAEAGKNVIVQKPIAMSLAEADSMIEAAKKSGVALCVADNYPWYPPLRKAGELITNGEIGDPISLRIKTVSGHGTPEEYREPQTPEDWRQQKARNGGYLYDDIVHYWNVAKYLMGSDIVEVAAMLENLEKPDERPGNVMWKHVLPNQYGSLTYGSAKARTGIYIKSDYYSTNEEFEIIGSKGIIWVPRLSAQVLNEAPLTMYKDGRRTSFETLDVDYGSSFRDNIHSIINDLLAGKNPELSGEEAKRQIRFAWATYKAAAERRTVRVDEVS